MFRTAKSLPYLAGTALDVLGFVASIVALHRLPLFVVQSAVAGSVGITAICAAWLLKTKLAGYERLALFGLATGLVLLALSAHPSGVVKSPAHISVALLAGLAVVVAVGLTGAKLAGPSSTTVLAVGAGLCWTGTGLTSRLLHVPKSPWHLLWDSDAIYLAAYGLVGTVIFAAALHRGNVTSIAAIIFAVETLLPSGIGIWFLGDSTRRHWVGVAALGFALSIGSSLLLARQADPSIVAVASVAEPPRLQGTRANLST